MSSREEAVAAAQKIAERGSVGFAIYWPLPDKWTSAESMPSLRLPGMKIIEVAADGQTTEIF